MDFADIIFLSFFIFIAAVLYSSVGHGGASGYMAAMALFGLSPLVMKPTGLVLNILVSSIAVYYFYRKGYFSWPIFIPLVIAAMPFAYIGGSVSLPNDLYKIIAGLILMFGAYRLFLQQEAISCQHLKPMPIIFAVLAGAGIGFISGLIGVGGGIFLSPILIMMNWATTRQTAGISAAFILFNSVSGLLGHVASVKQLPEFIAFFAAAAVCGGLIGSRLGSRQASNETIRRLLSIVLVIAGLKLIFV
jgi:uncharacterized membrane protein YfcA